MDDNSSQAFAGLFKAAYIKCFGYRLQQPLTEAESKLFYNQLLELTGLVVGWKSLKNYSFYVLDESAGRQENPSTATLDTLARYILNAPYTTETERKAKENHYPYWFQYKEQFFTTAKKNSTKNNFFKPVFIFLLLILIVALLSVFFIKKAKTITNFSDNFHELNADSLKARGWFLQSEDTAYWNKRNENNQMLSLYTLHGDNWPDSNNHPVIKNLLLRKLNADCFIAEIHLQNFFPKKEWQQAGILLLEDTNLTGKSLRLSLSYNDFFGGFAKPKEIIIQAITSAGNYLSQPEEIAHVPVFTLDAGKEMLVADNLTYSALRIEKNGTAFRMLYYCGTSKNLAFKEAASVQFDMHPKYIGIFALKGFVKDTAVIPATISYFAIAANSCN